MNSAAQNSMEWLDGFLFVGNHPALDLLNTRLINDQGPVELLPDTAALVRWLMAAEILRTPSARNTVYAWGNSRLLQSFLRDLLVFREDLRASVLRFEKGEVPAKHFLVELNQKLQESPSRYALAVEKGAVHREIFFEPSSPEDLWSCIADSAARLFTETQPSRVRRCEGCVVHFHDISKKGSRRWCSMAMCGNRRKVAAYQQRQREST